MAIFYHSWFSSEQVSPRKPACHPIRSPIVSSWTCWNTSSSNGCYKGLPFYKALSLSISRSTCMYTEESLVCVIYPKSYCLKNCAGHKSRTTCKYSGSRDIWLAPLPLYMPHTHTAMPSRTLLVRLLSRIWVHALLLLVTQPEIMCTVHIMHANTLERTLSAIIAFYFGIRHTVHARGSENRSRPCFELNCISFCSSARIGAPGSEFHHIVPPQEIHGLGQFHIWH